MFMTTHKDETSSEYTLKKYNFEYFYYTLDA